MNTINLLPLKQNHYHAQFKQTKKLLLINLMLSLLITVILYFFYEIKINKINHNISQLKSQQAQQAPDLNQANILLAKTKELQEKINTIQTLQNETEKISDFLSLLPQAMPENLYLVNLSWHEHTGIIYGQADSNNTVIRFLNLLKDNPYFKEINLVKSDKRHEQDSGLPIYFVINFNENA
ncbi:MAG: PilN domain-containing protein [Legionellales bacterium]|jgi:Tfp pilus assembly protein PilN